MKKWLIPPLLLLLLFFFFIPSLLSTSFGKQFLSNAIGKKLGAEVNLGSLSLSWTGPQSATDIEIKRIEYQLRAEELYSPNSLLTLLFSSSDASFYLVKPSPCSFQITPPLFASLKKKGPRFLQEWSLKGELQGELNLTELSFPAHLPFTALGKLQLSKGEFVKEGEPSLLLEGADFDFFPNGKNISFDGKIRSRYGEMKSSIDLKGEMGEFLQATLLVKELPVALFSQSLSQLLGPYVNGEMELELQNGNGVLFLSAKSDQLTLPKSRFAIQKEEGIRLEKRAEISLKPNLRSWNTLFANKNLQIESISPFTLLIEKLSLGKEPSLSASTIIPAIHWNPLLHMGKMASGALEVSIEAESLEEIKAHLKGENLSFKTEFRYDKESDSLLSLTPALFSYTLTNHLFHQLLFPFGKNAELLSPSSLLGKVDRFSFSLQNPASSFFEGRIDIEDLEARSNFSQMRATFAAPTISFSYDGKKEKESFFFETKAMEEERNGGTISLSLSGEKGKKEWDAKISRLSTPFLAAFFGIDHPLEAVVGTHLDFSLTRKISSSSDLVTASLSSDQCSAKGALEKRGELLSLAKGKNPLSFELKLTPEGFNLLKKLHPENLGPYELDRVASIAFDCNSLSLPLDDWEKGAFRGKGTIENFAVEEVKEDKAAHLSFCQFSVEKIANEPLFTAELLGTTSSAKRGKTILLPGDLRINLAAGPSLLLLNAKAEKFPSLLIDCISRLISDIPLPLSLLFGAEVDLTLSLDLQNRSGPVNLLLSAQKTQSTLRGMIREDSFSLREPFTAKLEMTPELSSFFLRDLTGKIESIQSTTPLSLLVPKENVHVPMFPFSLEKAEVPKIELNLGKLLVRNGGNLSVTLGLLKLSQFSRGKELSLWFTPTQMELSDGILYIDRTEILVDGKYRLAIWGAIDFLADRVDMRLGVPKETLMQAFAIQGLPNEYTLQIPIQGTIGKVEIDSKVATAKIAALLLWSNKSLAKKGGGVLGGLIDTFVPLPDSGSSTPPAKRPFPWE